MPEQLIREALAGADIRELRRLTGGASRETWSFDALLDGAWRPLVIRRDRAERAPLTIEAVAISAATRAGVPEPADRRR